MLDVGGGHVGHKGIGVGRLLKVGGGGGGGLWVVDVVGGRHGGEGRHLGGGFLPGGLVGFGRLPEGPPGNL